MLLFLGGLIGAEQNQSRASEASRWPLWWLFLALAVVCSSLTMAAPQVKYSADAAAMSETEVISSAVPISSSEAVVQFYSPQSGVRIANIEIDANQKLLVDGDFNYSFPEVRVKLPASNAQWREWLLASWPLSVIEEANYFEVQIDGELISGIEQLVALSSSNPENAAHFINYFRTAVLSNLQFNTYGQSAPATQIYSLQRSFALISAAAAVISLLLLRRYLN